MRIPIVLASLLVAAPAFAQSPAPAESPPPFVVIPTPVASPPPASTAVKVGALTTGGVSLLGLALGLKFHSDVGAVERDLDPYRRFPCPGNSTLTCNAKLETAAPLTSAQASYVHEKRSDGDTARRNEKIAFVTGGVAALVSGYLFYKWIAAGPEVNVALVDADGTLRPGLTLAIRR
jgi:hypothetical protein